MLLVFILVGMARGAVDGTVMNRTTGEPQPNATVTLYKLGEAGMDSLESVRSDAQGRFRIDRTPQGPHLIQTAYDGVTYNHMLPPGSPTTGLTLEVFNSSTRSSSAKVVQHMVLLEPVDNQLFVSENIIFQNEGRLAYNDPDNGTLRIFLPEEAGGQARVMARAPNGMPIQRAAQKTNRPEVYKIDFPIKPGETRFDVSYVVSFSSPSVFSGRALHGDAPIRLIAPAGVSLAGEGLESLGQEPHTQASIYGVAGQQYKVEIQGAGTLRTTQEALDEEDVRPSIEQILPRVYDKMYWILGLGLLILALGFALLYRSSPTASTAHNPPPTPSKGKRRK
jgi:hypothetical protein